MKGKIIEVLKDFRALKPLEQVNQLEYYAEVIHSLYELPTEEEIDQAIHDICVLEERLTRHYQAAQQPLDEIRKLQKRQRQAITNLLKGEKR